MNLRFRDGAVFSRGGSLSRRVALVCIPPLIVLFMVGWFVRSQWLGGSEGAGIDTAVWTLCGVLAMFLLLGGGLLAYLWECRSRVVACALEEGHAQREALLEALGSPVFVWGARGVYLEVNESFATLVGVPREALVGAPGGAADATPQARTLAQLLTSNGGKRARHEVTVEDSHGGQVDYVVSLAPLNRGVGAEESTMGVMIDCTRQKAVEKDLLQIRAALDDSADGVLITDLSGTPIYINAVFGYWFGFTPDQKETIDLDGLYGGPGSFQALAAPLWKGEDVVEELVLKTYYERFFHVHLRGSAVVDEHFEIVGALFLHTDVTEQKRLEAELEQLSRIDGLTGIHNRRAFDDRLAHEWRRARREQSRLSLIMLDIDAFKRYNDHYGHQEGDACLKEVAAGIAETFQRPGDFVARYGGEEFAIIIADEGEGHTVGQAERLRAHIESLALPHADSPTAGVVTISIGLAAMTPSEGGDESALIQRADEALYRAKEAGRNRVCHNGVETS